MNRIEKAKSNIKSVFIIYAAAFTVFLSVFFYHCYSIGKENKTERFIYNDSVSTEAVVDIHPRGNGTDSWMKTNVFDYPIIAEIYEITVTNYSGHKIPEWNLRIDITEECYLNNEWCGEVEIHQNIEGEEKIQTLNLRSCDKEDITLNYFYSDTDLMIPLNAGDYIIYYPDTLEAMEAPLEGSSNYAGQTNAGIIFYNRSGNMNFSNYTLEYKVDFGLFDGTEGFIYISLFIIFGVFFVVMSAISFVAFNMEKRIERQNGMIVEALSVLSDYVDSKDVFMEGHSERVAGYSRVIAEQLGMTKRECDAVYYSGLVHDIGNCSVPDYILKKSSKLSADEYETVKTHTVKGALMLEKFKSVPGIQDGARYHHEKYDGTGYPEGLKGESIPLIGRIIAVAEAYDAMKNDRAYRTAYEDDRILNELVKRSGTQFDPLIVGLFTEYIKDGKQ